MAFLSGVHVLTGSDCKLRRNTKGSMLGKFFELWLPVYVHVFRHDSALDDIIGSHDFAPLEALTCVCLMAFLSGCRSLTG